MKLKVLNRLRRGLEVFLEIDHERPGYRRWIMIGAPTKDPVFNKIDDDMSHQFAITIFEKLQPKYEIQFGENEGFRIEKRFTVPDEEALFKALLELVPSTDGFDVPWRAYTWESGQKQSLK